MEPEPGQEILCPGMTGSTAAGQCGKRDVGIGRLSLAKKGAVFVGPGGPLNGAEGPGTVALGLDGAVHAQEEAFDAPRPGLMLNLVEKG